MRRLTRLFKILLICFLIRGIFRISKNCVQVKISCNFFKEVGCLAFYLPASGTEVPLSIPFRALRRAVRGFDSKLSVLTAARRGKLPASRFSDLYAITLL